MSLSLIVPTYNRAEQLRKSIPTFLAQDFSPDQYEIIVVDNNSTDNTAEVIRELFIDARCQCTYVQESNQGLHHARNRGIKEAVGDIVVFGDDDILATVGWLSALAREFAKNPNAGVVGGRIKPQWDMEPPGWVFDYGSYGFHGVFAFLDFGDDRLTLKEGSVFGCNFAVRKDLAVKTGGSYPDTFPRRLRHLSGTGEYAIADNVRREGFEVIYLPGADVFHLAERSRATLEYFIDRHERWAVENIFDIFRRSGKRRGSIEGFRYARGIWQQTAKECGSKSNPDYYRTIRWRMMRQAFIQILRVLASRSLYSHITRQSYL